MSTKIRPLSLAFSAVLLTVAGHADAQNVANGKRIFTTCAYCHGLGGFGGAVGPSLKGVVGRRAASVDGFPYSDAMRASNLTWTPANLALFLASDEAAYINGSLHKCDGGITAPLPFAQLQRDFLLPPEPAAAG